MKPVSALLLFIFATLSLAQNIIASYPPAGTVVHGGKNFTVELDRPVCLSFGLPILSLTHNPELPYWLNRCISSHLHCFLCQIALRVTFKCPWIYHVRRTLQTEVPPTVQAAPRKLYRRRPTGIPQGSCTTERRTLFPCRGTSVALQTRIHF